MRSPQRREVSRRVFLGAATALLAVEAVPGASAAAVPAGQRNARAFLVAAMDAHAASGPISLSQSYADEAGLFTTAFTYDNALAVLALLALGDQDSRARAVRLGDALRYAQLHDPEHGDGRLRQAYDVGPYTFYDGTVQPHGFVLPDGTANIGARFGFVGTAVGDMAWAGLALMALAERLGESRFLTSAVTIGEWIERNARGDGPLGGYRFGVDGRGNALPQQSTEHNIDLVALFGKLARYTRDPAWAARREHARAFVLRMWNPDGGFFHTGTNDGVAVNRFPVPEDAQTWAHLAMGGRGEAVDWVAKNLAVTDHAGQPNSTVPDDQRYDGVTFSTASLVADDSGPVRKPNRAGVWFEGTAHLALALRARDRRAASRLLASVEQAQDRLGAGQSVGGVALPAGSGVVAASSPIDSGFGFGYFPHRHVGATAWYLLAATGANPFR